MSIIFEEKTSLRAWGPREIATEAAKERPDHWPTIAAFAAVLIGATALIALQGNILRAAPSERDADGRARFAGLEEPWAGARR